MDKDDKSAKVKELRQYLWQNINWDDIEYPANTWDVISVYLKDAKDYREYLAAPNDEARKSARNGLLETAQRYVDIYAKCRRAEEEAEKAFGADTDSGQMIKATDLGSRSGSDHIEPPTVGSADNWMETKKTRYKWDFVPSKEYVFMAAAIRTYMAALIASDRRTKEFRRRYLHGEFIKPSVCLDDDSLLDYIT